MDEQDEHEYKPMTHAFYSKCWWLWLVQAVAYIVVISLYFVQDGKEIVFAIYIPVDCLLFVGMALFYV